MKEVKYIIGIDWGAKRCGIALADVETMIASGYGECKKDDLVSRIKEISKEIKIKEIVMGISNINENKKQNKQIEETADQLKEAGFVVKLEEEMFSTRMAQQHLLEAKKKEVSKKDNIESARVILQGWIDKKM